MNNYKLGSLFDGSGGFPLAGTLCGIEPVWAAEVEPYPIAVTRSRFPRMKHLGDISKVNGADIEPVDIITFGSPCQDLSVAGKRAGLKHEANGDEETTRSGLFMEAVRIIKEMRNATNGKYPTFALWENVPGAFSSNRGEDFRIVCEELIKIVEPTATMPEVPQKGWNYADSFIGDGWSLAYRVLDAQYWGVPQRRRRIYLVADFRGERAREVLFEREGLRGYFTQGRTPWQGAPTDAQGSAGADDREGEGSNCVTPWDVQSRRMYTPDGAWPSLYGGEGGGHGYVITDPNRGDRGRQLDDVAYTLKIRSGCEGGGKGALVQKDKSATLATNNDQYLFQPVDKNDVIAIDKESYSSGEGFNRTPGITVGGPCATLQAQGTPHAVCYETPPVICLQGNGIDRADTAGCNGKGWKEDTSYTLNTIDRPAVAYGLDRASFNQGQNAKFDFTVTEESQPTLTARGPGAIAQPVYNASKASFFMRATENGSADTLVATDYKDPQLIAYDESAHHYIVRRLTPTECARLQGFADRWGDIEQVDRFSAEEYEFWKEVRNTHARINGKKVQDHTVKQMVTWYNKLWTDSAEYKMWGNGIALPTALYVMQGITDALNTPEDDDDSWME